MAKKHFELVREIAALRSEYHKKRQTDGFTIKEERELSARIKQLDREAGDLLTDGSNACPTCGSSPIGIKRNKGRIEIGCLPCENQRSEADTQEEAVANWNAGELSLPRLEDLNPCNGCTNKNLAFSGPPKTKKGEFTLVCRECEGVVVKGSTAGECVKNWNNSIHSDSNAPKPLPIGKAVKETAGE